MFSEFYSMFGKPKPSLVRTRHELAVGNPVEFNSLYGTEFTDLYQVRDLITDISRMDEAEDPHRNTRQYLYDVNACVEQ